MNTQVSVGNGDEVAQIHLDGENGGETDINNKKKTGTKVLETLAVVKFTVDPGEAGAAKHYDFWIKKLELYLAELGADDCHKIDYHVTHITHYCL